jgi:hypothetical protein
MEESRQCVFRAKRLLLKFRGYVQYTCSYSHLERNLKLVARFLSRAGFDNTAGLVEYPCTVWYRERAPVKGSRRKFASFPTDAGMFRPTPAHGRRTPASADADENYASIAYAFTSGVYLSVALVSIHFSSGVVGFSAMSTVKRRPARLGIMRIPSPRKKKRIVIKEQRSKATVRAPRRSHTVRPVLRSWVSCLLLPPDESGPGCQWVPRPVGGIPWECTGKYKS